MPMTTLSQATRDQEAIATGEQMNDNMDMRFANMKERLRTMALEIENPQKEN